MLAKLISTKPGLITTKEPINPTITADHLLYPTFSPKKIGEKAVTIKAVSYTHLTLPTNREV